MIENKPIESSGLGIGDISKMLSVADHTIRYWEKEFSSHLSPNRTKGRQRRYADSDIKILQKIQNLLKVQGYSIKGAKRILDGEEILSSMDISQEEVKDTHALALQIAELVSSRLTDTSQAA